MKDDYTAISHCTSLIHHPLESWENVLFEPVSDGGEHPSRPRVRCFLIHRCPLLPQTRWIIPLGTDRRSAVPVRAAGRVIGVETKVAFAAAAIKRRRISLCDSNPVISPVTATPSPANHQHCAVPSAPVAPEADLVPGLNVAITLGLLKPLCAVVLSAILHVAAAKTLVTGPHFSIPEVAVTCEFRAERLSRQAVGCGLQQSFVAGVVAAGDLELCSLDGPESRGDRVCVVSGICSLTDSRSLVVPILAAVLHPVLSVVVREPGYQSPALLVAGHVAEDLVSHATRVRKLTSVMMNIFRSGGKG